MTVVQQHYVLAVRDLNASVAWYRNALGCREDVVDPGNWVFMRRDGVTFMLGSCPEATPASDLGDHSYFAYLVVDDVDAYHKRLKGAEADVLSPPSDKPWGMREMAVRTIDGHRMMLAHAI